MKREWNFLLKLQQQIVHRLTKGHDGMILHEEDFILAPLFDDDRVGPLLLSGRLVCW